MAHSKLMETKPSMVTGNYTGNYIIIHSYRFHYTENIMKYMKYIMKYMHIFSKRCLQNHA